MLVSVQDIRVAARRLARARAFAATTVATLALGIGCTTLVFSIVNGLLLRSIPYADPDRLAVITPSFPSLYWSVFEELHDATDLFDQVSVYTERAANLSGGGPAERVLVGRVDGAFFPVTGVRPALGRPFLADDLRPGREKVVLLTDAIWRRRYGASRDVVGRIVEIDGDAHAIVGVLPPDFRTVREMEPAGGVWLDARVAMLVPLSHRPRLSDQGSDRAASARGLTIIGRLRNGASFDRARSLAAVITDRTIPPALGRPVFALQRLPAAVAGELPRQLAILSAAVAILLLVACANVANLMLERLQARRREIATRAALGASASQLVGGVMAESLLLGVGGGLGGVFIAWAGVRVFRVVLAPALTRLDDVAIDLRVLAFAAVVSVGTAMLTGLVPAIRQSRTAAADWLQAQASAPRLRGRLALPTVVVVTQVALSVVLIIVSALLARDFVRTIAIDTGFRTDGILTADVSLNPFRYEASGAARFFADLLERAERIAGAERAALVTHVPAGQFSAWTMMQVPGRSAEVENVQRISEDYFSLLSVPIVAGRPLGRYDNERTLVVNESFARKYWGSPGAALNQQLTFGRAAPGSRAAPAFVVVGVAADAHEGGPGAAPWPTVYESFRYVWPFGADTQMTLLLRARHGDGTSLARPLFEIVRSLDPDQPLYNVLTLEQVVHAKFARQRVMLMTMALFGALTLLLAAIGVHGVMAYAVALRRQEIGVRLALGGSARRILGLVAGRAAQMLGAGLVVGVPAAVTVVSLVQFDLFDIGATDAVVCFGAAGIVAAGGVIASLSPALRATRVDPIETLRSE